VTKVQDLALGLVEPHTIDLLAGEGLPETRWGPTVHPAPILCGPPVHNNLHIQEVLMTSNP